MSQLRPTFSESWYRVAGLKARLRGSTQISRQHYRGDRWYVVRDPAGNQYHRLSAAAYRFVGLLDGTRTVGEAWDLVGGQLADDAPTQPEVIQILSQLHAANLLEANIPADAGVLLRRHKKMQQRQLQGRLMNVLFPRIPLWDPDRFLCKWMPVMRHLLSKLGALIWLTVVIWAIAALTPHWRELKSAAAHAIDFKSNAINYLWIFISFVVIKLIHELGHAFSCRRFGGEVHELGIMFLVFMPAPYVHASSAWALPNKWARAFVGLGGMIFELFVAAILSFVWLAIKDSNHVLWTQLCFNTMLIASVSTVVFNANPLLRYDGYYILSDLLEIPNLRQKSMEYSFGLIKRHVFRVKSPLPLPPIGQRIWLLLYAITSGAYRIFVGVMIILVVTMQVPVLGVLMALGGLITWAVVPVVKTLNYLLLEPELHRKRGRAIAFTGAFAAAVIVAIGVIRWPMHIDSVGMTEPKPVEGADTAHPDHPELNYKGLVNASGNGFVQRILVRSGQQVKAGDPLVELRDEQLVADISQAEAQLNASLLRARAALDSDRSMYQVQTDAAEAFRKHLANQLEKRENLIVRSPTDGVVMAPDLTELQGRYLRAGDPTGITVGRVDELMIYALLDQSDAALAYDFKPIKARVRLSGARSAKVIEGTVVRWDPAAAQEAPHNALTTQGGEQAVADPNDKSGRRLAMGEFPVYVRIENPGGTFLPGQRAYLRFDLEKKPLLWQWGRRFMQIVQQTQGSQNKWQ